MIINFRLTQRISGISTRLTGLLIALIIFLPNASQSQYLQPGDGVRLTFYNLPENLSGDYFILPQGDLPLPYIGVVRTAGIAYDSLEAEITRSYKGYYRDVELIVRPLYRVSILGEVRSPGVYYLTGVETLLDAIALAGGETSDANLKKVQVFISGRKYTVNLQQLIENRNDGRHYYLKSGDRIYIHRKWWVAGRNTSFLISAAAVVVAAVGLLIR